MIKKVRYLIALSTYLLSPAVLAQQPVAPAVLTHSELSRVFFGLLFILLLIFLLSWVVKRLNVLHVSSSKGFEALANMSLGPKEKIILLKVGTRYLLIGVGASSINTLYDFGEQLPEGFEIDNKSSFAALLKSAVRKS